MEVDELRAVTGLADGTVVLAGSTAGKSSRSDVVFSSFFLFFRDSFFVPDLLVAAFDHAHGARELSRATYFGAHGSVTDLAGCTCRRFSSHDGLRSAGTPVVQRRGMLGSSETRT